MRDYTLEFIFQRVSTYLFGGIIMFAQPVSVTLGISYDFWTLAELAKDLGKKDDYNQFAKKGLDYKNLWDPKHQLFIPKDDKGNWIDIDPKSAGGRGYREYYDENNGWRNSGTYFRGTT